MKWLTKAAEQGFAGAQYNLAINYYKGKGVPQNFVYAYVWSSLAAASGHKSAIINRDITIKKLSPKQLGEAQEIASKKYAEIEARKNQ